MNIIVTSIGKRIQLIEHLKEIFTVVGVDASEYNPARYFVDEFCLIPRCNEDDYIEALLETAKRTDAKMIIPLYEAEFVRLCENREAFERIGTKVLLSDEIVIDICNDKYRTQEFFERERIKTPGLTNHAPAVLKPICGMGSQGVFFVNTDKELEAAKVLSDNYIIQELISGTEYTIDVLCDFNGNPISIVPRIREEVRSGEVVKSRTEHNKVIIEATRELIEALNRYGKVIGPITVQCFWSEGTEPIFIEINPRFGGGVLLSIEAGVNYAECLKAFLEESVPDSIYTGFEDMSMMRYDRAVYISDKMEVRYE